jgi:hypothetical protein
MKTRLYYGQGNEREFLCPISGSKDAIRNVSIPQPEVNLVDRAGKETRKFCLGHIGSNHEL